MGHFSGSMSLYRSFCLRQFCSPLFGIFRFVPGFIESDKKMDSFKNFIALSFMNTNNKFNFS